MNRAAGDDSHTVQPLFSPFARERRVTYILTSTVAVMNAAASTHNNNNLKMKRKREINNENVR
jgi:hypothetical protein